MIQPLVVSRRLKNTGFLLFLYQEKDVSPIPVYQIYEFVCGQSKSSKAVIVYSERLDLKIEYHSKDTDGWN